MDLVHETDERLMRLVALGRREALSILLRRYANQLLTFLRRMTGNHHLSEELFQDVFVAVWTHRRRYETSRTFRAWLFGIAANKCRAEFRRRSRQFISIDSGTAAMPVSRDPSPPEEAIATETTALVEQAVMRLPEVQRQVVVLRIWNGYSYPEIASILSSTESTVRSNMCHGLAAMRRFLERRM